MQKMAHSQLQQKHQNTPSSAFPNRPSAAILDINSYQTGIDIESSQQLDKKMEIKKQELSNLQYIRSENQLIDHSMDIRKKDHYNGDGEYQHFAFSYFYVPCFPSWQPMHFYASGCDLWQEYQRNAMKASQAYLVKQETADNNPTFASEPIESIIPGDDCLAAISNCHIRPKSGASKARHCYRRRFNSFFWTLQENRRYLKFLKKSSILLQLPTYQKKCLKVNVLMSFIVKSRNGQQCHSHHQKLMKKYGSIDGILANFEKDLAEQRRSYRKSSRKEVLRSIDQIKIEKPMGEDRDEMKRM